MQNWNLEVFEFNKISTFLQLNLPVWSNYFHSSTKIAPTVTKMKVFADEEELLLSRKPHSVAQPADPFHFAYFVYFILGAGFLIPWNAYLTAVDYFTYLYPSIPIDRIFSIVNMSCFLISLIIIITLFHNSSASLRINTGLVLFILSLLITPMVDWVFVKGRQGVYFGYDITVGAVFISSVANSLVQGGIIGSSGEMPEIYMQAVCSGTGASGELLLFLIVDNYLRVPGYYFNCFKVWLPPII